MVKRLQARDQAAVAVLYDNYCKALYGVSLKIMRSEEAAEDVVQETFLKIWTSIDSYHSEKGSLFTWMLNICRNLAIDKLRSRQHRQMLGSQRIEDSTAFQLSDDSSRTQPDHIGLGELTEKLKPEQKILIDLLYFEGFTQTEAAEQLQIPLGTVKTRVRAALKTLAALF